MVEVTTSIASGRIRGRVVDGCATFLGIPFAPRPVGKLRFQPPQPVTSWSGVRDCLEYGPTAPHPDRGDTLIPEPISDGESYLNLNVVAPHRDANALLRCRRLFFQQCPGRANRRRWPTRRTPDRQS
jgi:carboxylesterase type B